jgi:biopolymer transport protein TolR
MGVQIGGSRRSRVTLSEINVTPLVDVMLVLLIMFMVTTPLMQQGIEVDLPKTAASGVQATDDPFVLVVHRNKKVTAGNVNISIDQMESKLRAIFKTRKNKQLYLQADKSVEYGFVAEVMAEIRRAGITNVGLVTLPKTESKSE